MRGLLITIVTLVLTTAASGETSTYVFVPDQSELVQTGGIAYVHWTYSVEGYFELAIDPNAGTASFTRVDANATDDSPLKRTLDPNQVFNMTSLVGTALEDGTIKFTGKASEGSDILITMAFVDDLAHLIGHTTPPPHSADFFIFDLDAIAQRKYSGGTGEPNDPYQIATAADLMLLGETPEDYDKHFILTADIDLDPNLLGGKVFDRAVIAPDTNDAEERFQGTRFNGVFDGNGQTVSHLTIEGVHVLGLFGALGDGAKISDLALEAVDVSGMGHYVGGLVGENDGSIAGCYSTGTVSTEASQVGGLVGKNLYIGSVSNCYSSADVGGTNQMVGGLVGFNLGWVSGCYSTGDVYGFEEVGGLVGANGEEGSVSNCYSTGSVSGGSEIGGLAGSNDCRISRCYSTGDVNGVDKVGGLLGFNDDCWGVNYCYSTGSVSGEDRVGGMVGENDQGSVRYCYSTGYISGTGLGVGGLVGENDEGDVRKCFWDIQTSGQLSMCGSQVDHATGCDDSYGKTTSEMQTAGTFLEAGWDFINIWGIGENQTYPYLRKYSAADINQNESVDFGDIAILAENWLAGIAP